MAKEMKAEEPLAAIMDAVESLRLAQFNPVTKWFVAMFAPDLKMAGNLHDARLSLESAAQMMKRYNPGSQAVDLLADAANDLQRWDLKPWIHTVTRVHSSMPVLLG